MGRSNGPVRVVSGRRYFWAAALLSLLFCGGTSASSSGESLSSYYFSPAPTPGPTPPSIAPSPEPTPGQTPPSIAPSPEPTPGIPPPLDGLSIPDNIAAAMVADATGGFAGPGSLTVSPAGTIELEQADAGSVVLSGVFVRDDGTGLPSSASAFVYIDIPGEPDDFTRGQATLIPSTGAFSTTVVGVPAGNSRLFLSFVVVDPAEALDPSGADTVFALDVSNDACDPSLRFTLEWFDDSSDVDLHVIEPGGNEVFYGAPEGLVGSLDVDDVDGFGPENYILRSELDPTVVLGEFEVFVVLFNRHSATPPVTWRLTARVSGEVAWVMEGDLSNNSEQSATFALSLSDYDPRCGAVTTFCGVEYTCATATDTVLPDAVCTTDPCGDDDCCTASTPAPTPAPTTPAPTTPAPTTPAPTTPAPTTPAPTTPAPTTPAPTTPAPTTPAPTTPAPTTPAPTTPAPTTPAPTTPATTPAPTTPAPSTPAQTPAPTTPGPTTRAPTPAPTTPGPITPGPTVAPTTPGPTTPGRTPAPTTPGPTTPAPTAPGPTTPGPTPGPTAPTPSTVAPTTAAPVTVSPTTTAPTMSASTTTAPITAAPGTAAPTTAAPTTTATITAAPVTAAPTTRGTDPPTETPQTFPPSAVPPTLAPNPEPTLAPIPEQTLAPLTSTSSPPTVPPTAVGQSLPPNPIPTLPPSPSETISPTTAPSIPATLTPTADQTLTPVPQLNTVAPTRITQVTTAPAATPVQATIAPIATLTPANSLAPVSTSAPAATVAPIGTTLAPVATVEPASTVAPVSTFAPATSIAPAATTAPEATPIPGATLAPTTTLAPGTTLVPVSTSAPAATVAPAVTTAPGVTLSPTATLPPGSTLAPVSTSAPASTVAPAVTTAPGATLGPIATLAPGNTVAPLSTLSPEAAVASAAPQAAPADDTSRVIPIDDSTSFTLEPSPPAGSEPPTDAPSTPGPADEVISTPATTVAAGAASTLAVSGVVLTTVSTLIGGTTAGASGAAPGALGQGGSASAQNPADQPGSSSTRQPAATMALMLIGQIQFLATLSLVSDTGATDSNLSGFAQNLRWVNLWPPQSFAEGFTPASVSEVEVGQPEDDTGTESDVSASVTSDISSAVFMGNFVLFAALLSTIFVVHVALASAVEAYWLTKKRATQQIARAQRLGVPLSELPASPSRLQVQDDPDSETSQRSQSVGAVSDADLDEEGGLPATVRKGGRLNMNKIAECREKSQSAWLHFPHVELVFLLFAFEGAVAAQVAAVRENSSPTVLILAVLSLVLFPILMVVMVSRTFFNKVRPDDHIIFKTHADDDDDDEVGDESASSSNSAESNLSRSTRNFAGKVKASLKDDHSMFAWANKGQWESAETTNTQARRERDWFRIGFEPLFVDFTKSGSWFIIYSLIELAALGVVGVVVDDSVLQLWLFCAMHSVSCLLLVVFKPFANWIINAMGIALYGTNAVCMAVLAVSADQWEGSSRAEEVDSAVMIIQLVTLLALIIPIYVDTSFMMMGAIGRKLRRSQKPATQTDTAEQEEERAFTRRYVRKSWARTWCTMLGKNVFACLRDTTAGVESKAPKPHTNANRTTRLPRTNSARTGPHPPLDLSDDVDEPDGSSPRRLGGSTVGTVNMPLVVLSPRSAEVSGQNT